MAQKSEEQTYTYNFINYSLLEIYAVVGHLAESKTAQQNGTDIVENLWLV